MPSIQKKKTPQHASGRRKLSRKEREIQLRNRILIGGGTGLVVLIFFIVFLVIAIQKDNSDETAALSRQEENTEMAKGTETVSEPSITPTPEPEVPDYVKNKPDIDINSWEYILANSTHSIETYRPEVEEFEGVYLDSRIIDAMDQFVSDTRAQGLEVVMTSGYRSYDTQMELFQNKVDEYGDEEKAATIVARPGTSEHQTGLAADICDDYYEYMNESLEQTDTYQWMSRHCQDYGFIVRFPKNKEDVTGIIYEPWHYRYVGKEAAAFIMENNLTLEEFVELYQESES